MIKFRNFKTFYRTYNAVYLSAIISTLLFMTVVYALSNHRIFSLTDNRRQVITGIVSTSVIPITSQYIFHFLLNRINANTNLQNKILNYFNAIGIKLTLLQFTALINILLFYYSSNIIFLIFSGFVFLLILLTKPDSDKISLQLNLRPEEKNHIENPGKYFSDF